MNVYIRFSVRNVSKTLKDLANLAIEATSDFPHLSSSQLIKKTTATGKVADNLTTESIHSIPALLN
jgi:hypothetical protein